MSDETPPAAERAMLALTRWQNAYLERANAQGFAVLMNVGASSDIQPPIVVAQPYGIADVSPPTRSDEGTP